MSITDLYVVLLYAIIGSCIVFHGFVLWIKSYLAGAGSRSPFEIKAHALQTIVVVVVIPASCFTFSLAALTTHAEINTPYFVICCETLSGTFYLFSWAGIWLHELKRMNIPLSQKKSGREAEIGTSAVFLMFLLSGPQEIVSFVDILFVGIIVLGFFVGKTNHARWRR